MRRAALRRRRQVQPNDAGVGISLDAAMARKIPAYGGKIQGGVVKEGLRDVEDRSGLGAAVKYLIGGAANSLSLSPCCGRGWLVASEMSNGPGEGLKLQGQRPLTRRLTAFGATLSRK